MMRARIGMVNFINTAPLYEIWKQSVSESRWQIVEASPSALNRLLFENKLDLGFVSSHEYALHPHQYRVLADLSISASGKVGSVFLFSKTRIEGLHNKKIRLSPQSQTSNSLLKILLEEFRSVHPCYVIDNESGMQSRIEEEFTAELAIGDQALRLAKKETYPYVMDLSEEWKQQTGLPFVFAVWAVRRDFCTQDPDCVVAIHHELKRCIKEGKKYLWEISREVAKRIPMDHESCFTYLQGIEYDLTPVKKKALELFFQYLIKREEAPRAALPIAYCG